MDLASVKCIISGAAQGLGRHFALRLCQAGAQVAIGDVNPQGLADTLELARGSKGKLHARPLDVSQEADVRAFVEWAHASMGGLNAVINNAGILRDGLLVRKDRHTGAVTVLPKEQWDAVLAVNLTGATLLVREGVRTWWSACPASRATEIADSRTTSRPRRRSRRTPSPGPGSSLPSASGPPRWRRE